VRRILGEIDPTLPVIDPRTMAELIARPAAPASFALVLVVAAAVVALLLGSVGVYAVVAYAVGRRTREIGVRMAIGASAGSVRTMVFVQGGAIIAAGIVGGLLGAAALMRLLRGMLFGVSPNDPISYVAVTALMLAVGSIALFVPARRASRVDPLEALRSD
jgi:ABC-type antimicrobial peptide transport system permease subunit